MHPDTNKLADITTRNRNFMGELENTKTEDAALAIVAVLAKGDDGDVFSTVGVAVTRCWIFASSETFVAAALDLPSHLHG